MTQPTQSQTLIIGLSGPSSSGKTTLARLLRGVFNIDASTDTNGVSVRLFILHEDDFYKSDANIPLRTITSAEHGTREEQDWDCIESLNQPLLDRTIRHVKSHGTPPPDMVSKEDKNTVGDVGVSDDEVAQHRASTVSWLSTLQFPTQSPDPKSLTICILDGFLLFPPPPRLLAAMVRDADLGDISTDSIPLLESLYTTLADVLDVKVFLPLSKEQTLHRRARRTGYVTMEGFWQDPPGYVEDVVWPNYARDHAWMFGGREDVDLGLVDRDGEWVRSEGVVVGPGNGDVPMKEILPWGVGVMKKVVERVLASRENS